MKKIFETISVIGLGYIGLPTAAAFAAKKIDVIGVDVDSKTVDIINQGNIHIVEPGLDTVVHAAVNEGYLRATTVPEPADAFIVAVPTPFKGDYQPNLDFIKKASKAIAPVLKKCDLIILESTCPVGATEKMTAWLAQERPDLIFPKDGGDVSDINIAHCPERVLPGHIMRELVENDRIIGGITERCTIRASELYKIFVEGECIQTNARTAELSKLTENSFRDVNIAFANELSLVCEKLDINVWELISLANRHPRVNVLQPGPGVGGHCIAVDPWFIVSSAPEESRLIRTAREVNDNKPEVVISKVLDSINGIVDPVIACLGLAFKADIDDLRESPAVYITEKLASVSDASIFVVEPNITSLPDSLSKFSNITLVESEAALKKADVVVLLVDHTVFKGIDRSLINTQKIIDTRGIW